jgi:hypothetical protein
LNLQSLTSWERLYKIKSTYKFLGKPARVLSGNQGNTGGVKSAKEEPSSLLSAAVEKLKKLIKGDVPRVFQEKK